MPSPLSTTSYAVLGMLALRDWTPYELTQQMRRSLVYCWPTSERALYSEPERLVAAGLATMTVREATPRARRAYSITHDGRVALREWLATTPASVRMTNEPLLRLLFADQADVADLLAALEQLRASVAEQHREGAEMVAGYLDGAGPFPHRAHLVALFADLYGRLFTTLEQWADDAAAEVRTWKTTKDLGLTERSRARLRAALDGAPGTRP